jgi:hypothetical protein
MNPTCETCKYRDKPTEQCRRFAPTGVTISHERLVERKPWTACWPIVSDTDWCGDHVERPHEF